MFIAPDLSKKKGDNFDSLDKGARQAKVRKQEQTFSIYRPAQAKWLLQAVFCFKNPSHSLAL